MTCAAPIQYFQHFKSVNLWFENRCLDVYQKLGPFFNLVSHLFIIHNDKAKKKHQQLGNFQNIFSFKIYHMTSTEFTAVHYVGVQMCYIISVLSDSLRPYGLQPARFLCSWNSPGKNTEVGCHFHLHLWVYPNLRVSFDES